MAGEREGIINALSSLQEFTSVQEGVQEYTGEYTKVYWKHVRVYKNIQEYAGRYAKVYKSVQDMIYIPDPKASELFYTALTRSRD